MQTAVDRGIIEGAPKPFATNRMVVIIPASNPGDVRTLEDLERVGLRLVLAQADVPAGRYARESIALMQADREFPPRFEEQVLANIVSEEPNVKAVVAKVQLGEADAAVVYATDVTAEIDDDVDVIEIPPEFNVQPTYLIGVTSQSAHEADAARFVDYVLSPEGRAVLARHGFGDVE
jgi:molybdate transport system substrate-binding protein